MNRDFWNGRSVFVTGHTGFKGGWLSTWLADAGAQVHGYSLSPPTMHNFFDEANVAETLATHTIGDIRDLEAVSAAVVAAKPDIVFHMAAQPLVRLSYSQPVDTFATNVMGTVNVLEATRRYASASAFVSVTTDKCYENREWNWGYRENEALGGRDPYSASKAGAELVTAAWRSSFHESGSPWIASARAGNVIGGGDWALDRLIPDALRSYDKQIMLDIRHPDAVRPWQHVLEPLSGYIRLAERLHTMGDQAASAWNFGPADEDALPVREILDRLCRSLPELRWRQVGEIGVHEAGLLKLDSSRARLTLGWKPKWRISTALEKTAQWHRAWRAGKDMREFTLTQIADHESAHGDA